MKKVVLFIVLAAFVLISITGCPLQVKPTLTAVANTAYILALNNNPSYKAPIVAGLNEVKSALNGSLTYDALITQIAKSLPAPYNVAATILQSELDADQPVSTTILPMTDSYKASVSAEIDRLIVLAGD